MFIKKIINFSLLLVALHTPLFASYVLSESEEQKTPHLGVWITVFSPENVLGSKGNVDKLITSCKKTGIDQVYLQIYRADKAYYNSQITDKTPYETILSGAGSDTINYLLNEANKNEIKIYAWLNLLSLAQNTDANILKKYGEGIITKDPYGRTSLQNNNKDALDKYYIRENQLFLEPGDKRVRDYLTSIAEEIIKTYPKFSGLHLDYIRYPAAIPFIPGSRFSSHGISYGYTDINTANFKEANGLDINNMYQTRKNFKKWDDWRKKQVTLLVKEISNRVRSISPSYEISCTIVPSIERTYLVTFQDWTEWLKKNYIDYIVVMNYTDDADFFELTSKSLLEPDFGGKIYMGVGAYLFKDNPDLFKNQLESLKKISPDGIIIFSYDNIAENEEFQEILSEEF